MLRYYRKMRLISKNILFTSFSARILDLYQKPFAQIQNFVFLQFRNVEFGTVCFLT